MVMCAVDLVRCRQAAQEISSRLLRLHRKAVLLGRLDVVVLWDFSQGESLTI